MTTDDVAPSQGKLQARCWFVRNAADHSSEQHASFQAWLAQSADHWRCYNSLRRLAAIYSDPATSADPKNQ
jgi:ferric-dicitrate binding protein FerR (iron transport regulator)